MASVVLHVGHGKTGSSYIQSSLALSAAQLSAHGIFYPWHSSFELATQGKITSGNAGYHGPQTAGEFLARVQATLRDHPAERRVLFSSEFLFHIFKDSPSTIAEIRRVAEIEFLLFIRNPLEHAIANYQQMVKRHNHTGPLGDYLRRYQVPMLVKKFVETARDSGIALTVMNYSNHKNDILRAFAEVIGVPPGAMCKPPVEHINRSLTQAELALQISLNRYPEIRSAHLVSLPLCEELPSMNADPPHCETAAVARFLDRINPLADAVNRHLPDNEGYRLQTLADVQPLYASIPADRFSFTQQQLDVLAKAIAAEISAAKQAR